MPIKSLVRAEGKLPELGILRKGAVKPERGPGRDLTWFRFTSERPGVTERFYDQYGKEPTELHDLFLMAPTPEEAFSCWMEEWGAGSLKHRCDGEYVVRWQNPKTGKFEDYPNDGRMSCPGGCQRVGRLSVLLPRLGQLATVCLQTSSIHDLIHIPEQLNALYALAQVMPGHQSGSLLGIPICLRRDAKKISVPGQGGKPRARMAKSLISIEAEPSWFAPKLDQLQAAATPTVHALATETVRTDVDVAPRAETHDVGHEPDEDDDGDFREIDETTGEITEPTEAPDQGLSGESGSTLKGAFPDSTPHEDQGADGGGSTSAPASPEMPDAKALQTYESRIQRAHRLGIDLAGYEITSDTDLATLRALYAKLGHEISAQ